MSKQDKLLRPLVGHFLGWGDDRIPHRYIKLSTPNGEQLIKVAKNLRPHIQNWQPGIWLTLIGSERMDRSTGETKIKVKQLLTPPSNDSPAAIEGRAGGMADGSTANISREPTTIRVCQGSSCRRKGSEQICRSMQAYLDRYESTDSAEPRLGKRVQIETVKCIHQCKAGPHAIVTSPVGNKLPGKTHYRQLQPSQVKTILAKHFPPAGSSKPIGSTLIEKIGCYLDRHRISTSNPLS